MENQAGGQPADHHRLQNRVILIINGISESGRKLANMLARQGADVAIADSRLKPELAGRISREVADQGQRCLVLTPAKDGAAGKKPFSQVAIETILDTLGRLDAFISYSASNDGSVEAASLPKADLPAPAETKPHPRPVVFDRDGLTRAALDHILEQSRA